MPQKTTPGNYERKSAECRGEKKLTRLLAIPVRTYVAIILPKYIMGIGGEEQSTRKEHAAQLARLARSEVFGQPAGMDFFPKCIMHIWGGD